MDENIGCVGYLVLAVLGIGLWVMLGDPARDVRRTFGQQTYEDRVAELEDALKGKTIGQSGDQWLIKNGMAGPERVALFFGYWSDFEACYEFATTYMERYPLDSYDCEYAN